MREISATEFKAKCLHLMDEVAESGDEIIITKKGKPVVRMGPIRPARRKSLYGLFAGEMEILGDIMSPIDVEWDAMKE